MSCSACKLKRIIAGWKNLVFENPEVERIALARIKVCASCKYLSRLGICKQCGCPIKAKARSLEETCTKWQE